MPQTFHLVPQKYFDAQDAQADYVPAAYAQDGFIHCTDGAEQVAQTGTRYYRENPEPFYYVYIDTTQVRASIRYEDPGHIYPHIYGPLNRDAIVAVRPARRLPGGEFLPPDER